MLKFPKQQGGNLRERENNLNIFVVMQKYWHSHNQYTLKTKIFFLKTNKDSKVIRCPLSNKPNTTVSSIFNTLLIIFYLFYKYIGLFIRAGEPEPGVFAAPWSRSRKKLAGSSALREDKKHKEIVL